MPGVTVFDKHVNEYEQWFVKNPHAYISELHAVRELLPPGGKGFEIGAGTGRFAAPLGIAMGIEPSPAMAELAGKRGIEVVKAVAEKLPFKDNEFDFALMVTTICFLDDLDLAFGEVRRVLKPGGSFIIGFVDKNSPLGKFYQSRQGKSVFYKDATFYSVDDILSHLKKAAFADAAFRQTIFRPLGEIEDAEPVKEGYGEGSFVVVRGVKKP
ncbi:MAG: class I SAM-dependent methyltransferase [Nitrospirota bacterium]